MTVASAKTSGALPRWVGYLAKPVLLGLACLALYLYVSGLELDSIEQRELNAETITQRFVEHLQLTAAATVAVVVLAVSAGVLLTRPFARRISPFLVNVAGRGMGMSKNAVLFRIELPLAVPIMLAGIRTALVITIGTATLATFIG